MEIKILGSTITNINFPKRKLRNRFEQNWNVSKKKTVFLNKLSARLCGSSAEVVIDYQAEPYIIKKMASDDIKIESSYFPESIDSEIKELLVAQDKIKLSGKTIKEVSAIDLLESGMLDIHGLLNHLRDK
jgi:hypothetical protein